MQFFQLLDNESMKRIYDFDGLLNQSIGKEDCILEDTTKQKYLS